MSKAIQFSHYGGPAVLELVDLPQPDPGPGQVRIAIRAIGVNPFDTKVRSGLLSDGSPPEQPLGLGSEMAGSIDALGEGVDTLAVGVDVAGSTLSPAYAEHALADPASLVAKPAAVPFEVAAGLTIPARTAYRALEQLALAAGDTLLIHAAAGGVGLVAAQLARARGAAVVGTASERNHEFLRSLGVTPVSYGDGLGERVRAAAPTGIDAVLDGSGRGELPLSVELAGGPERVLTIVDPAGAEAAGVRFSGGGDTSVDTSPALPQAMALVARGELELPIWKTYPLAEAAAAHAESERGHLRGKIVLVVG